MGLYNQTSSLINDKLIARNIEERKVITGPVDSSCQNLLLSSRQSYEVMNIPTQIIIYNWIVYIYDQLRELNKLSSIHHSLYTLWQSAHDFINICKDMSAMFARSYAIYIVIKVTKLTMPYF